MKEDRAGCGPLIALVCFALAVVSLAAVPFSLPLTAIFVIAGVVVLLPAH